MATKKADVLELFRGAKSFEVTLRGGTQLKVISAGRANSDFLVLQCETKVGGFLPGSSNVYVRDEAIDMVWPKER